MKYYSNETFSGQQGAGAAIIKARNKEHAVEVLTSELRKRGREPEEPLLPEDMVLWPLLGEQVRILND
jgi:hypothetical protein